MGILREQGGQGEGLTITKWLFNMLQSLSAALTYDLLKTLLVATRGVKVMEKISYRRIVYLLGALSLLTVYQ